jgi:hypothetical protein
MELKLLNLFIKEAHIGWRSLSAAVDPYRSCCSPMTGIDPKRSSAKGCWATFLASQIELGSVGGDFMLVEVELAR